MARRRKRKPVVSGDARQAVAAGPVPLWIRPGQAYRGWGWVLATAALWSVFAVLLAVLGELQRELSAGAVTGAVLGYYLTAVAALFAAYCGFLRRRWAWQLTLVTSAPMLMLFPVGTAVAAMAMRALWRARGFFEASRS